MAEISHPEAAGQGFTQANQEKQPVYEVGFHIVPTIPEEGVGAVVEWLRKELGNAELIAEGFPQRMKLAYVIERAAAGKRQKYAEAYFGWIKFASERENIPALQGALLANPDILRSLVVETVREDISQAPRRAVFNSDRLEGKTLEKPASAEPEKAAEVSEEELDKSLEALTG